MAKIFLKLGKVMGSSRDPGHVQWIELSSCTFPTKTGSPAAPVPPLPGSNAKPQIELQCAKGFDVSSGALLRMASDGSVVDSATVEFVNDRRVPWLRLSLCDVILTSFSTTRGAADSVTEVFGFNGVLGCGSPDHPAPKANPPTVFFLPDRWSKG